MAQAPAKSGVQNKQKARQSRKKAGYYQRQHYRTIQNKVRRLKKRIAFDPTAEAAIERLKIKSIPK